MSRSVSITIYDEEGNPSTTHMDNLTEQEFKSVRALMYIINGPTDYELSQQQYKKLNVTDLERWRENLQDYLVSDVLQEIEEEINKHYDFVPIHHSQMVVGQTYYIHPSYAGLWRDSLPDLSFKLLSVIPHHSEPNQFILNIECTKTGEKSECHEVYANQRVLIPKEI